MLGLISNHTEQRDGFKKFDIANEGTVGGDDQVVFT
jgi:hypothetical protein